MLSRQEIIEKLRDTQLQNYLKNKGIEHLSLFGSYARDEAKSDSDLDLLIQLQDGSRVWLLTLWAIEQELLKNIPVSKIDFVSNKYVHPMIRDYIEKDVISIY